MGEIPTQPSIEPIQKVLEQSKVQANDYIRIYETDSQSIGGAGGNGTLTSEYTFTQEFWIKYFKVVVNGNGYKTGSYTRMFINEILIYEHLHVDPSSSDLNETFNFIDLEDSVLLRRGSDNTIKLVTHIEWNGTSVTYQNSIEIRGYFNYDKTD